MEDKSTKKNSSKRDRKEAKNRSSESSPEDVAKRERKTSPEPTLNGAMEELLRKFTEMAGKMDIMQRDIATIRNESVQRNKDLDEMKKMLMEDRTQREKEMKDVRRQIGGVTEAVGSVKVDIKELKIDNSNLRSRMVSLEREAKKQNILVSGIEFDAPKEGFDKLQKLINEEINDDIKITGLRTFKTRAETKVIVAACRNMEEKTKLFAKKKSLKIKDGDKTTPVFINSDLPKEDREIQRKLRTLAKQKRDQGCEVNLAGNKMKIDGKWFRWNGEEEKLVETTFRV